MDGDDWDLHAVVRGYTAAAANSTAVIASDDNDNDDDAPLSSLSNVSYHQTTLDYSGVENTDAPCLQGLREICRDVYVDPPVPVSVPVARALHTPLVENQLLNSNSFQIGGPPPSRPRRRKTQPMKMVRELTQEELAADPWAWRKYGQKPIKGSSYPRLFFFPSCLFNKTVSSCLWGCCWICIRSYYRCSTSKCCLAKKHVERSPNDPSLFLVSYTGEHTHPRPAQRSTPSSSSSAAATKIPPSPPSASNITAEEDNGSGGGAAAMEQTVLDGMAVVTNCDAMLFHPFSDTGDDELFSSAMISSPRWSPSSSTAANGGGEEEKGF